MASWYTLREIDYRKFISLLVSDQIELVEVSMHESIFRKFHYHL